MKSAESQSKHTCQSSSMAVAMDYLSLTKPVAVLMIALVTIAGMALAHYSATDLESARAIFSLGPSLPLGIYFVLVGFLVSLSSAGAFTLNQYYEREIDRFMPRAKNRALPQGRIAAHKARLFGFSLFLIPTVIISLFCSTACGILTFICGALYVWAYTPLKRISSMSTFVGAVPGALLPLMGWAAIRTDMLNMNVLFPAALLFIWQVPHALVIVLKYEDDYRAGGMKQLPLIIGRQKSLQHMFFSTLMTASLSLLPMLWVSNKSVYVTASLVIGALTILPAFVAYRSEKLIHLRQFFVIHLMSLPLQLIFFVQCL